MQEELEKIKKDVKRLGGEVLDQPDDVVGLTEEIDRHLPKIEEVS